MGGRPATRGRANGRGNRGQATNSPLAMEVSSSNHVMVVGHGVAQGPGSKPAGAWGRGAPAALTGQQEQPVLSGVVAAAGSTENPKSGGVSGNSSGSQPAGAWGKGAPSALTGRQRPMISDSGIGVKEASSRTGDAEGNEGTGGIEKEQVPKERKIRSSFDGNEEGNDFALDYVVSRPVELSTKKGITGRQVQLITNYYELTKLPQFCMTLYAVKIEPQPEQEYKIRALVQEKRNQIGAYLLSGLQMFTPRKIPEHLLMYYTQIDNDITNYKVVFEYKRVVAESEPLVLQFYNIIVRHIQQAMNFELLGRHFFDARGKVEFPSWKLECWPGFQNSIRQQESALMLNVESVWKVVQTETILEKMGTFSTKFGRGPEYQRKCNEEFIGTMVMTKYNNRAYKISSIEWGMSENSTFSQKKKMPDGRVELVNVSYRGYYQERYEITVKKSNQPLLVSKPTKRDIRRGMDKDIYLVPELCFPCGLNDTLRSNFKLMREIATCLHMEPDKRVQTMNKFIGEVNANVKLQKSIQEWEFNINRNPVGFTARFLPAETILLGNNKDVKTDLKADWTEALKRNAMLVSKRLSNWLVVVTARDRPGVGTLVNTIQDLGRQLGYTVEDPALIKHISDNRPESYERGIKEGIAAMKKKPVEMILVVLANNSTDTYSKVKRVCTMELGVPTQCFLAKNINNKGLLSICRNVVIQMNAKQGGEPWNLSNPLPSVMVLGYDVHHAGAGGGESVGAMTATTSRTLGSYYSVAYKMDVRGQEVATKVAIMFEKCLRAYFKCNGKYPERLMMYRDGVGEGQLRGVCTTELEGVKQRVNEIYEQANLPRPKLSYIVVSKRINTRFFEVLKDGKFKNPNPGLIVDDVVTRPERYDFYLTSQYARQGCVGSTYYNVIHDESGLSPDRMQLFTYKLCHLYFNWSGTVSVPAPCQNAHKYAFQVGTAIKGPTNANLEFLLHYL